MRTDSCTAQPRRPKPSAIICHTVKGKGAREAENNMHWHHKSKVEAKDVESLLKALEERR